MKETTTFQFYAPEYKDPINVKDITNNFIRLDEILESFTVERKLVTNTFNELKVYPPYYIIRNDNDFDVTIYDRTFEEEYIIKAGDELQKMVNEGVGLRLNMLVQGLHDVELTYYISTEEAIGEASGSDYRLASVETTEYAASYKLQVKPKGASDFIDVSGSVPINIPKDKVIKSGDVKTCQTDGVPAGFKKGDKYIDLVIDNDEGSHIYIPVNALVDNTAEGITYSNATSKLTATNVQTAIDEVLGVANSKQAALTEEQLSAVNSGITAEAVEKYEGYENDIEAIEKTIKGSSDAFIYDSTTKMTKVVPDDVNKGVVSMIGGKTVKQDEALLNAPIKKVVLSGANMFDKTKAVRNKKMTNQGTYMDVNNGLCSDYISVTPNTDYYLTNVNGLASFYTSVFFDENKKFIGVVNIDKPSSYVNGVVRSPEKSAYMVVNSGVIHIDDIMVTRGTIAPAEYIPYSNKTTILLDKIVDKLPDYGASAGDVYNYIDFEEMVYHHNVGSGNLLDDDTWVFRTSDNLCYNKLDVKNVFNIKPNSKSVAANFVSSSWNTTSRNDLTTTSGNICVSDNGAIIMYDANLTSLDDYKAKMENVKFNYELATPEGILLSDILTPFVVEPNGTIEFVNEHNLDVPNTVIYEKEVLV